MKKSQIMAVFALALALGAVAPIAGVVGGASAVTEPELDATGAVIPGKEGKASVQDAKDYQTAVIRSDEYQAFKGLNDLKNKITAATAKETALYGAAITGAEVDDQDVTVAGLAKDVADAYVAIVAADKVTSPVVMSDENLSEAIAVAKANIRNYATWTNYVTAKAEKADRGVTATIPVYETIYATLHGSAYSNVAGLAGAALATALETAIEGEAATYANTLALVQAVNKGEAVIKFKADLKTALANLKTATTVSSGNLDNATWATVFGKIATANATTRGVAYTGLATAFGVAPDGIANGMTDNAAGQKTNYTKLAATAGANALLQWVADLWNMDVDDLTPTKVIGHKSTTPSTDPGTTDTPAGDEDNTDTDVNAPNTGILSSAEGSATTISIVAGLTTALASLGAGVVAYRSARRGE